MRTSGTESELEQKRRVVEILRGREGGNEAKGERDWGSFPKSKEGLSVGE